MVARASSASRFAGVAVATVPSVAPFAGFVDASAGLAPGYLGILVQWIKAKAGISGT